MTRRPFFQVDVFSRTPYLGNPLAVVLEADGLETAAMQRLARWTNLSETTFALPPTRPGADYRLRIFTPGGELPFAGHPTLGSCCAWLAAGGKPARAERIVQECAAGLIELRRTPEGLAFAAPPLVRSGPLPEPLLARVAQALRIERSAIDAAVWVDNGPAWIAVLLHSAQAVLELQPGPLGELKVGVLGPCPPGSPEAFEVRGFFPKDGTTTAEDPVTGSLNAGIALWLLESGRASAPYWARQGTALQREGRIHVSRTPDGAVWIAGGTHICARGEIEL